MKTATISIYIKNPFFQWNWDGFDFIPNGTGDAETFPMTLFQFSEELEISENIFKGTFKKASEAKLYAILNIFDPETEETEEIEIYSKKR